MSVHFHSDRPLRSGRHRPCPVCGRVKDSDCSFTPDRAKVFCHHQRVDLIPLVDQINGYTFIQNNRDGRTALFLLDEFDRRQW